MSGRCAVSTCPCGSAPVVAECQCSRHRRPGRRRRRRRQPLGRPAPGRGRPGHPLRGHLGRHRLRKTRLARSTAISSSPGSASSPTPVPPGPSSAGRPRSTSSPPPATRSRTAHGRSGRFPATADRETRARVWRASGLAVALLYGVPPDQRAAALRVRHHQRAETGGTPSRCGRHRSRVREPRPPVAGRRGREARRGRPQPAQPPLLRVEGHPEAAPSRHRSVLPQIRRRARSRHRGRDDDRRQGRPLPPDVGARRARRHRVRPVAVLPDPHLRAAVRRGRHPPDPPDERPGCGRPDDRRRRRHRTTRRAEPR